MKRSGGTQRQPKPSEPRMLPHLRRRHFEAEDASEALHRQRDALLLALAREHVDHPLRRPPAAQLDHQLDGPGRSDRRQLRAEPLLEARGGVGAQLQRLAGAADARPPEVRRLQQDRARGRRDLALAAAHDPGDRDCPSPSAMTSMSSPSTRSSASVEQAQLLARLGAADDDPLAPHLLVVEGVQRLAHLQHHVVRYVDDVVDRPHPYRQQPLLHPLRRLADLHALDDGADVARAEVRIGDLDGDHVLRRLPFLGVLDRRVAPALPGHRRGLAGDADDRQPVRAVRRQLQVQNRVADDLGEGRTHGRVVWQHEDAGVLAGQAELFLRADHAL